MIINNNSISNHLLLSQRSAQRRYAKSAHQLATGEKNPVGSGGGAALSMADKFRQKYLGTQQLSNSMKQVEGYINTQERALNNVSEMVDRMMELAVASSDPTKTDGDRAILNTEFQSLLTEIGTIASDSQYSGTKLFGTATTMNTDLDGGSVTFSALDLAAISTTLGSADITTSAKATTTIAALSSDATNVNSQLGGLRSAISINQRSLQRHISNADAFAVNMQDSESFIRDVDIAEASIAFTTNQIQMSAVQAMIAQSNAESQNALRFFN